MAKSRLRKAVIVGCFALGVLGFLFLAPVLNGRYDGHAGDCQAAECFIPEHNSVAYWAFWIGGTYARQLYPGGYRNAYTICPDLPTAHSEVPMVRLIPNEGTELPTPDHHSHGLIDG